MGRLGKSFILVLNLLLLLQHPVHSFPTGRTVGELILSKMSLGCTLIYYSRRKALSERSQIFQHSPLPFYNFQFQPPPPQSLNQSSSPRSTPEVLLMAHGSSFQFASQKRGCSSNLVVIDSSFNDPSTSFSTEEEEFLEEVEATISPVFTPLAKMWSDHFIIITWEERLNGLLLKGSGYLSKLKYKLGVGLGGALALRSLCFFCANGGPRIVTHPTASGVDFPNYLSNMEGTTLRISCPNILALIQLSPGTQAEPTIKNAKRGIWKNLLEDYLMVRYNFTYSAFISSGKGGTGAQLPNGTWTGVVGDLLNGEAHVGIITAQTPSRIHKVSFTSSFFDITFLTFVTTVGGRVFSPKALLWPFTVSMWMALLGSTLVAFTVFYLLNWGMDYTGGRSRGRRNAGRKKCWGIGQQILFVTSSYLDQDACVLPESTTLRCFLSLWLFFVLIITTVYRSKMVALLAHPVIHEVPSTFEQLSKSRYSVGFMKHGDAAYNTLKASKDRVYSNLFSRMEVVTGAGLECLQRTVSQERYACIGYDISEKYLNARNFSDADSRKLVFSPDSTFSVYLGLALRPGSMFKEDFDKMLARIRPANLQAVWSVEDSRKIRGEAKGWWRETGQWEKLKRSEESQFSDLTLQHVSGSFYVLVLGLVVAAGCFLAESAASRLNLKLT